MCQRDTKRPRQSAGPFNAGITRGKSESLFGFNDDLKRSEFVTFLCRTVTKTSCSGTGDHPFVDTAGYEWADYSIAWAYDEGITSGISSTEFGPHQLLTKEQALTFLHRAVGTPTPSPVEEVEEFLREHGQNGYTSFHRNDMNSESFYYTALVWASWKGVFNGETLQAYGIDSNVPRGQAILWLCRVFGPGTNTCLYGNFPSEWDSGGEPVVEERPQDSEEWTVVEGETLWGTEYRAALSISYLHDLSWPYDDWYASVAVVCWEESRSVDVVVNITDGDRDLYILGDRDDQVLVGWKFVGWEDTTVEYWNVNASGFGIYRDLFPERLARLLVEEDDSFVLQFYEGWESDTYVGTFLWETAGNEKIIGWVLEPC